MILTLNLTGITNQTFRGSKKKFQGGAKTIGTNRSPLKLEIQGRRLPTVDPPLSVGRKLQKFMSLKSLIRESELNWHLNIEYTFTSISTPVHGSITLETWFVSTEEQEIWFPD